MIEKNLDKINHAMQKQSSLVTERRLLAREELLSFMIMHPVSTFKKEILTPYLPYSSIYSAFTSFSSTRFLTASLLFLAFLGGGISYAAEGSLPGDSLYLVKTNVNEQVRGWFVLSSVGDAKLQAEFAEERIREIEKLAVKGAPAKTLEDLKDKFEEHALQVETALNELQSSDSHEEVLDLTTKFESSLKAHETVLKSLPASPKEVKDILESVGDEIGKADELRDTAQNKLQIDTSFEKNNAFTILKIAKDAISEAEHFIDESEDSATPESRKQSESKLKKAQKAYTNGRDYYNRKKYSDAYIEFQLAFSGAKEAKIYLEIQKELELYLHPKPEETPFSSEEASTTSSVQNGTTTDSASSTSSTPISLEF